MVLLPILAQETLRLDSEKRIYLKEKALLGKAKPLREKNGPFYSHLPKSTSLLYLHGFYLANEVVRLLLVSEDLENQI